MTAAPQLRDVVTETEASASAAADARPDRLLTSWRQIFVLYGVWLVPALIFTSSGTLSQGDAGLAAWAANMGRSIWIWLYWASLSPWIYRLLVAVPPTWHRWARFAAVHAAGVLATILGLCVYLAVVRVWVFADPRSYFELFMRELTASAALGRHLLNVCKYGVVRCRPRRHRAAHGAAVLLTTPGEPDAVPAE